MKIHLEFEETELVKVRELIGRIGPIGKTEDFIEYIHKSVDEPSVIEHWTKIMEEQAAYVKRREDLHKSVEEPSISDVLDIREHAIEQFVDETKLTDSQKAEIKRLYDTGLSYQEIKAQVGITNKQSRAANGLIQLHKRDLAKKASNKPVDESQPHKVRTIRPPAEVAAIEATARQEADEIIRRLSGKSKPLNIANRINREVGGNWLPDDVAKRQRELGLV